MTMHDLLIFINCVAFAYAIYGSWLAIKAKRRKNKR